jgi:small subunit ribosomal protein S20
MANHYSALKRTRQIEKRTEVNRRNRTRLRHQIRELRRALQANDDAAAAAALPKTISIIDRSVQKGVLTKNTAARYKSRLSVRVNALKAAVPAAS